MCSFLQMLPWQPRVQVGQSPPHADAGLPLFCAASFPRLFSLRSIHYFSVSQRLHAGEDAAHDVLTRTQFGWLRRQDKDELRCVSASCTSTPRRVTATLLPPLCPAASPCRSWGAEAKQLFDEALLDPMRFKEGLLVITMLREVAEAINLYFRSALPGSDHVFAAEGDNVPGVPRECRLRNGQRVRVTLSQEGAPAGSVGTVVGIDYSGKVGASLRDHTVRVQLDATRAEVAVVARAFINENSAGHVIGTCLAMPLEDGFAVTVNSSQGCSAEFVYVLNGDGAGTRAWLGQRAAEVRAAKAAAGVRPPACGAGPGTASSVFGAASPLPSLGSNFAPPGVTGGWSAAGGWYTALTRGKQASRIYLHGFTGNVVIHRVAVAFTLRIIQRKDPAEYASLMCMRDGWLAEVPRDQRAAAQAAEDAGFATADAVLAAMGDDHAGDNLTARALSAARYGWSAEAVADGLAMVDGALELLLQRREGIDALTAAPAGGMDLRRLSAAGRRAFHSTGARAAAQLQPSPEDMASLHAMLQMEDEWEEGAQKPGAVDASASAGCSILPQYHEPEPAGAVARVGGGADGNAVMQAVASTASPNRGTGPVFSASPRLLMFSPQGPGAASGGAEALSGHIRRRDGTPQDAAAKRRCTVEGEERAGCER